MVVVGGWWLVGWVVGSWVVGGWLVGGWWLVVGRLVVVCDGSDCSGEWSAASCGSGEWELVRKLQSQ